MKSFRDWSLKTKLTSLIVLTTLVTLSIALSALMIYEWSAFKSELEERMITLGEMVAANNTAALAFNDSETAHELLQSLSAEPEVARAVIYRSDGSALASFSEGPATGEERGDRSKIDLRWRGPLPTRYTAVWKSNFLEIYQPVKLDGKQIGALFVRAHLVGLRNRLGRYLVGCALVVVFSAGLAVVMAQLLQRLISRPILQLSRTMASVAQERDYSVRQPKGSEDEVGGLIDGFNSMLAEIEMRDRRLNRHQQELEQLVAERTSQLSDANRELKLRIEEAQLAREAAEAASRAKSQFLANMSHEIRTPMHGVLGMIELLSQTDINATQRHFAESAFRSGRNLLHLIDELLDFSKIEAGKLTLEEIDFDLNDLLADFMVLFQASARRKDIELNLNLDPAIPGRLVGDPHRLRQILSNLTSNALKFTSDGWVKIDVQMIPSEPRSVGLKFSVTDTGIGLPAEARDKILEPFTQADGSTTRRYGGTGLGLTIARQLAEMMAGQLGLESQEGKGSTFWFTAILKEAREERATSRLSGQSLGSATPISADILLVEDNPVNQEVAIRMLRSLGCRMDLATDGREALSRFSRRRYDLILMDCQMPGMGGYEATEEIRKIEKRDSLTRTPIIALSAHATRQHKSRCAEAGMDGQLSKPFSLADLQKLLWQSLGSKSAAAVSDVEEEAQSTQSAIIDLRSLADLMQFEEAGGIPTQDLIADFLHRLCHQLEELTVAVDGGDWEAGGLIAHNLKAASGFLGAISLSELFEQVEEHLASGIRLPGHLLDDVRLHSGLLSEELPLAVDRLRQTVHNERRPPS